MDQDTYLKNRVTDQINWYERKSAFNKNRYKLFKTIVIIVSVTIPFLTGLITGEESIWKIVVGVGGVSIALIEGLLSLNKYQELWHQYRLTAEMLNREKIIYLTESGPYLNNKNKFKDFVANVESIMSGENKSWLEQQQKEGDPES